MKLTPRVLSIIVFGGLVLLMALTAILSHGHGGPQGDYGDQPQVCSQAGYGSNC